MSQRIFSFASLCILTCLLAVVFQPVADAQTTRSGKEVYRGNITYIGGPRGAVTDFFTLTINSYTPDAEVSRLMDLLKREGQDDFQRVIDRGQTVRAC